MTIAWVFISFVLYCINMLLPLVVIIIDAVMLVGWIAAVARYLRMGVDALTVDCGVFKDTRDWSYYDDYYSDYNLLYIQCNLSKTLFALMVVVMYGPCPPLDLLESDEISHLT